MLWSYRESKKLLSTLLAPLLALCALAAVLIGIGTWRMALAAPIVNENVGFWSDTFSDATGLNSLNGVALNAAQQHLELTSTLAFSQTNWHGGAGLSTTSVSTTDRYATGVDAATGVTGELSLGFSLAAPANLEALDRDGYPDLVFTNFLSGSDGLTPADVSYLYYGSASGFLDAARVDLPVLSAIGSAVADLNDDGYLDLVVARDSNVNGIYENYIFWGGPDGYSEDNRQALHGLSSTCVVVADLDLDGYLDIVFCNFLDSSLNAETDSYVYWGAAVDPYTVTNRSALPTTGAVAGYAADFDKDGNLDLLFNNYRNNGDALLSSTYQLSSYIYYGQSGGGFLTGDRDQLPTIGGHGSSVADLNNDGYLDLVISNRRTGGVETDTLTYLLNSYIYWGSSGGFTETNRAELPTRGSYGNSIADLNADGYPEIIFSNHFDGLTHNQDSYIYWNNAGVFTDTNRTGLPTIGATGNCVGDLNLDGYPDIVFSNRRLGADHDIPSYIYWGGTTGYTTTQRTSLTTHGALGCTIAGSTIASANTAYGNVYAVPLDGAHTITDTATTPLIYAPSAVLTSTGFDAGVNRVWEQINWTASITTGTDISIEVATSSDGVNWSAWTMVAATSINGANSASLSGLSTSRYIRYRATLTGSSDHRRAPVLHDVEITHGWLSGQATSTSITPTALARWNVITWSVQLAAGEAITVQVLDGSGTLIPNGTLPGNSAGFGAGSINISNLSISTYPALRLRANMSRTNITSAPKLTDWYVGWLVAPTANAGGPYSGDEGALIALDGSTSQDPAGETLTYAWDLDNDGQFDDAFSVSTNVSFGEPNTYTVRLLITDTQNVTATSSASVAVSNLAPTANAGGPYSGNEGASIPLNGSGSSDPGGGTLAYAWDLDNDGQFDDASVASTSNSWSEPGAYPVRLRVADTQGLTNTQTVTVNVANLAPTSNAGGPYSGNEGASIGFSGAGSSDPGGGTLLYAWDLNQDGQFDDAFSTTPSRSFSEPGTYTVGLVVSDTQGLKHSSSATVNVANLAPIANAGGPYLQTAGLTLTLNASGSSDPGGGVLTYTWDLDNDGQFDDGSGVTLDNVWTSVGNYTVRVRAQDSGLLTGIGTAPVTITAATLHHITLAPATATITNSLSISYTTTAYDAFNNALGDVSTSAAYTITAGAGGSWLNNVYTSQNPGTWTVTATHGVSPTLMTTATLTVKPEYKVFLPVVLR